MCVHTEGFGLFLSLILRKWVAYMVFKVHKNKNYTVMSNYHLREKEMSLKAKGLLSWMLSNSEDWDYSIAGIVANCKENETAIESALDELKTFGYLEVIKKMPNETESGRIEYVYNIYEMPKQGVENQPLEIQGVENQGQRSTIARSTKEESTISSIIINNNTTNTEEPSLDLPKYKRKVELTDDVRDKMLDDSQEEKKKEKRKNLCDKCLDVINDRYKDDDILKNALRDYLMVRLNMKTKKMYGVNQWSSMLDTLDRLNGDKVKIVKTATERGWAGFFEIKNYTKNAEERYKKFGEHPGMKSVRPEDVEGGQSSGVIF